jgi:hypothetical protein
MTRWVGPPFRTNSTDALDFAGLEFCCESGLGDSGDRDWGGIEEQGDWEGFAGFGGLQGVVFAGDYRGDGEHAVIPVHRV